MWWAKTDTNREETDECSETACRSKDGGMIMVIMVNAGIFRGAGGDLRYLSIGLFEI
jgi:hypothetical protein